MAETEQPKKLEIAILTQDIKDSGLEVLVEKIKRNSHISVKISDIKNYTEAISAKPGIIIIHQPYADPMRGKIICGYISRQERDVPKIIVLSCVSGEGNIRNYLSAGCSEYVSLSGTLIPYDQVVGSIEKILQDMAVSKTTSPQQ